MSKPELSEIHGVITHLHTISDGRFILAVRDSEGRVLSIKYDLEDEHTRNSIGESLRLGMTIKLYISGQVSHIQATYQGTGIITIID